MKKLLSILLTGVTAVSLAACGGSSASKNENSSAEGESYVIATDTNFAPFEFTNEDEEFVGIDVDLMNAIAEDQGFTVDWKPLGFDAAMAAVEADQADGCIAGASITERRKQVFDFSEEYFDSFICLAVREDSNIAGLEDLKGQQVAAKKRTTGAEYAESIKDQYGFEIKYFDQSDEMYTEVLTGKAAACFEDQTVMNYNCQHGNGLKIIAEQKGEYATPYGFVVLKGQNQELLEKFNTGLADLKESGRYDEIIAEYTGTE